MTRRSAIITVVLIIAAALTIPVAARPKSTLSDRYLQQWYFGYNETLFYNELPTNVEVHWHDLSDENYLGDTEWNEPGNHYVINVDDSLKQAPVVAQETLIHEMCHVEVNAVETDPADSAMHGAKWQGCMLRIAEHGGFKGVW